MSRPPQHVPGLERHPHLLRRYQVEVSRLPRNCKDCQLDKLRRQFLERAALEDATRRASKRPRR